MARHPTRRTGPTLCCELIPQSTETYSPQAYLYITRAFKTFTPHIMGALKLLADSYTADELNRLGLHMYVSTRFSLVALHRESHRD